MIGRVPGGVFGRLPAALDPSHRATLKLCLGFGGCRGGFERLLSEGIRRSGEGLRC